MAISVSALTDLITKHNNPDEETVIYNIQSTSGSNFFSGRLLGNIVIEGEDIIFTEIDGDGDISTIRTGMSNIDIVKFKHPSKINEILKKVLIFLESLGSAPALLEDADVEPKIKAVKAVNSTTDPDTASQTLDSAVGAVKAQKENRREFYNQLKPLEDLKYAFIKEFDSLANPYFTELNVVLESISGSIETNQDISAKVSSLKAKYAAREALLEEYKTNKENKDYSPEAAAKVEEFLNKLRAQESIDS